MKTSNKNIEKLENFLRAALQSKGFPTIGPVLHKGAVELLEKNGILLTDMMYNWSEFPKGFVPIDLGREYYALLPKELALKALALEYLDLK